MEITPEREYTLVTEFFAGAAEIGRAEVGDQVIGHGIGAMSVVMLTLPLTSVLLAGPAQPAATAVAAAAPGVNGRGAA